MIWFGTASGRLIDLERPQAGDIALPDVARGLSNCCRFAGQLPQFYSVAQHSVLVASLVDPPFKLQALLHDASEAYMGDLSRNLKHHELLNGYRVLEERLQNAIHIRFDIGATGLTGVDTVKTADNLAAIFEHVTLRERKQFESGHDIARMLRHGFIKGDSWEDLVSLADRLPDGVACLTPEEAERSFLRFYEDLEADGA